MFRSKALCGFVLALSLLGVSCSQDTSKQVRTYKLGEHVQLGHLIYTVFETQWLTQAGEGTSARVPQHRFMTIRLAVTNSGGSDAMVPNMTLVDDNNETVAELSNGEGIPQWMGYLRSVKPADTAQGSVVFDAAPKHYKLRITDEEDKQAGLIDIPLTFGAETPEIPLPEAPAKK